MIGPKYAALRWSPIDGPELRCAHCGEWWSIGPDCREYWKAGRWTTCLACIRETQRLATAKRRADDETYRQRGVERTRRYRRWMKRHHPDLVAALDREYRATQRERQRQAREAA